MLDDSLGYFSFDDSNFANTWAAIAPGADISGFEDQSDYITPPLARRGLHKRFGISFHITVPNVIKAVSASVKSAVQKSVSAISALPATIKKVGTAIVSAAKAVVKLAVEIVEGDPSITLNLPTNYQFGSGDTSPWGAAKLLHLWKEAKGETDANDAKVAEEKAKEGPELLPDNLDDLNHIAIYCVDCGFNGSFVVTGSVHYTLSGIKSATLDAVGNIDFNVGLGIDCLAIKTVDLAKKELWSSGTPGFSIPKLISVGPFLTVEAGLSFEMKAIGQMLVTAEMSYRNAKAHMDLLNPSNSYRTGWKPTLSYSADVKGELAAGLVAELPIGLAFGLDVLDGKFEKAATLVESVSLELEAKVEFDAEIDITANTTSGATSANGVLAYNQDLCYGVEWNLTLHNQLNFDVLNIKNYQIYELIMPIAQGCIGQETGSSGSSVSGTVSTPSLAVCSSAPNVLTNGNFESGSFSPWYISSGTNSQNSYGVVSGGVGGNYYLSNTENEDPTGANPYSVVNFRQDIALCAGVEYQLSFDFQFQSWQHDVYVYVNIFYDDGTSTYVWGTRSTDYSEIGVWKHITATFIATESSGSLQVGTTACDWQSEVSMFDNFVLTQVVNSKRATIEARQDEGVQLSTTADGSNEANDDTVNPDNLDAYNADGTLASPPDDSDIDATLAADYTQLAAAESTAPNIPSDLTSFLNGGADTTNSSYLPALPLPSVTYLNLVDSVNGSYQLSAGSDRNLYLEAVDVSSESGLFASVDGVYGGDFVGRWFYTYPAEMAAMNVSRIRLADTTNFPNGTMLVGLVGVSSGGNSFYVAATTEGDIYYLAACNIQGQNSKVFLVQDPVAGLATLQTAAASWTITGGVVSSCWALGFKPSYVLISL